MQKIVSVKWDERIEIMVLLRYRSICGNEEEEETDSADKTPYSKEIYESKYHKAHKLEGVAKLVILLRKISNCDKRHIKDNVLT